MKRTLDDNTTALLKKFSDRLSETDDVDDPELFQMYVDNEDNKDFVELSGLCINLHKEMKRKKRRRRGS